MLSKEGKKHTHINNKERKLAMRIFTADEPMMEKTLTAIATGEEKMLDPI